MSGVDLNASHDSSFEVSASSALNASSLSIAEDERSHKKEAELRDQIKKKRRQRNIFIIIIGVLILVLFINGVRSMNEKYSSTELDHEDEVPPITICKETEDFMSYEPCWKDYSP